MAQRTGPVLPEVVHQDRASELEARVTDLKGPDRLAVMLTTPETGEAAVVSSFGADSVVLLHQLSLVAPDTPVLFLDTLMLFPETLDYQREIAESLGLTDIRVTRAPAIRLAQTDPANILHKSDVDACCDLRKAKPLERALAPFNSWISGRKRFQSGTRAAMPLVEEDKDGKLKLNPLADWSARDLKDYIIAHDLPRHPLVAKGYPSIGCAPCTSKVRPGEDPRAGRWRNQDKEECGIHFVDGKVVRAPVRKEFLA